MLFEYFNKINFFGDLRFALRGQFFPWPWKFLRLTPGMHHWFFSLNFSLNSTARQSTDYENSLMAQSFSFFFLPSEVMQIKIYLKSGQTLSTKIHRGGVFTCLSYEEIQSLLYSFLKSRRLVWEQIEHLGLFHTHPGHEYLELKSQKLFLHPLSPNDLKTAKQLSFQWNLPVKIVAVTASEISYEANFKDA